VGTDDDSANENVVMPNNRRLESKLRNAELLGEDCGRKMSDEDKRCRKVSSYCQRRKRYGKSSRRNYLSSSTDAASMIQGEET